MNDAKAKEAARLQSFAEQLDRLGNSQMLACLWKRVALENWNAERKYIEVRKLMRVVTGVGAEDMGPNSGTLKNLVRQEEVNIFFLGSKTETLKLWFFKFPL